MKGNVGGLVVIAIAVFIIVMGIKGSQHTLFPSLFGPPTEGLSTNTIYVPPSASTNVAGNPNATNPDKNGKCPGGYFLFNGVCITFLPPSMPGIVLP